MRRIAIGLMSTISGLVLLFSYHTSQGPQATAVGTGTDPGGSAAGDAGSGDQGGATDSSSTGSSGGSGTYTGEVAQTKWGPVQVQITVAGGKITKAKAVVFPTENHHDQEINSWAIPQLESATVDRQGADFDSFSGATVTSDGYKRSLQSALDKAHL